MELKQNSPKTLYLNVSRSPFEVMYTGEKQQEFRKPTKWILSRLYKNGVPVKFDSIKITFAYGKTNPYFTGTNVKHYISNDSFIKEYSNGLRVLVEKGDIIIDYDIDFRV